MSRFREVWNSSVTMSHLGQLYLAGLKRRQWDIPRTTLCYSLPVSQICHPSCHIDLYWNRQLHNKVLTAAETLLLCTHSGHPQTTQSYSLQMVLAGCLFVVVRWILVRAHLSAGQRSQRSIFNDWVRNTACCSWIRTKIMALPIKRDSFKCEDNPHKQVCQIMMMVGAVIGWFLQKVCTVVVV